MERTTLAPICNVDLTLNLRIAGQSDNVITVYTDEGDGYTVHFNKEHSENNEGPTKDNYEEWIGQLETIITYLTRMKEKT